jgi:hypothetical protein
LKTDKVQIQISELSKTGDARGFSLTAPAEALDFLERVADIPLTSTAPGAVRGNHCHLCRREAIVMLPGAAWSLPQVVGMQCAMRDQRHCGSRPVRLSLTIQPRRWREKWCRWLAFLGDLRNFFAFFAVKGFLWTHKGF